MNFTRSFFALFFAFAMATSTMAQEIVPLPYESPAHIHWANAEKQYYSELWKTEVITNVSAPSLIVFKADEKLANGTSVIIAPGGGLYAHSINSEGYDVARWLNTKGITAFVLKYRLAPVEATLFWFPSSSS